ncbi:hypothetical protein GF337_07555 [candidate division KSB1 bacterium]|nr:hypothetical protein [candidate division KSB1 bacterium]
MKQFKKDLIIGVLIIIVGLFSLLINIDVLDIKIDSAMVTVFIFIAGFLFFMGMYLYQNRKEFWPLIPAFALLGIAILILFNEIGLSHKIGAGFLMIFIGLGFIMTYLFHRENWWALIPGGIMASISMVIFFQGILGVGLMFVGMGGVFFALYPVLKKEGENSWWTVIPGSILSLLGILFLLFDKDYVGKFILPLLLVAGGLYLIFKPTRQVEEEA